MTFYPKDVTGPTDLRIAKTPSGDPWHDHHDPVLQEARDLLADGVTVETLLEVDAEVTQALELAVETAENHGRIVDVPGGDCPDGCLGGERLTVAYWDARGRALARCSTKTSAVMIIGEGTSAPFNPDDGIPDRYPDRLLAPPISEFAALGMALGASCAGMRPFFWAGTSTFMYYAWSVIANEAPHIRYVSGGQTTAPLVLYILAGARRAGGVQHEQTPQAMLQNVPGLTVYTPSTPQSVHDVVRSALAGADPTVIVDHVLLGEVTGPLDEERPGPVDPVEVLREGEEGLCVATSLMSQRALAAADELAASGGPSVTVVNVVRISPTRCTRSSRSPPPSRTRFSSTSRVGLEVRPRTCKRVLSRRSPAIACVPSIPDAPFPFSTRLLDEIVPTVERIRDAVGEFAQAG